MKDLRKISRKQSDLKPLLLALLLAWLLPALACNLPTAPTPDPNVERAVQQTLAARLFPTPPPGLVDETPLPPEDDQPFPGLATPTPGAFATVDPGSGFLYYTQSGDTTAGLAGRFQVGPDQIVNPGQYPLQALLPIGQPVALPNQFGALRYTGALLPDSEVVYSPATVGFSTYDYVQSAGGYLNTYAEEVDGQILSGAQIVERVALETSTNPRLLLAVLDFRSHWVTGQPETSANNAYPIGFYASQYSGLYKEITLASRQLTLGYYGWRSGQVTELEFANHTRMRIDPTLNAGSVALQYLFSKLYNPDQLQQVLYGPDNFLTRYQAWFGDPWQRAAQVEPILPFDLTQPALVLPFPSGERWSFTGGPHAAWGVGSPWGGLDFAPISGAKGCNVSTSWATAAAPGLVVRSENGVVVLDLDMDGHEQTGWALMYLHVAAQDRVPLGTQLNKDDRIGHPSCEGGVATGTHVHVARKFNGEWLAVDGPIPFLLSDWQAYPGSKQYEGTLVKGDQVVTARPDGSHSSLIIR